MARTAGGWRLARGEGGDASGFVATARIWLCGSHPEWSGGSHARMTRPFRSEELASEAWNLRVRMTHTFGSLESWRIPTPLV